MSCSDTPASSTASRALAVLPTIAMPTLAAAPAMARINEPAPAFSAKTTHGERSLTDDKGILRAMIYYPMTNGRSIPEVLRLVRALQPSLTHGVATPEAWQPGDKVIVGSPKTVAEVEKRLTEELETTDWYFTVKELA